MRYATDTFVPFFKSVATGADIKRSAYNGHVDLILPSGGPANQSERAEKILKLASKEAHIDDQMDRRLHMNAAGYYHGLPGEQSVSLVASLAYGTGIYAN